MIADREGATIASQGLYARAHDFARFGELLRRGGVNARGEQVVPAAWIGRMTRMTEVSGGDYGLQPWKTGVSEGAYMASGFEGQKITVVPETCLTAVRLSHSFGLRYRDGEVGEPDAYGFGLEFSAAEWGAVVAAVADALGGCDGTSPSRSAATTEGVADSGDGSGALAPPVLLILATLVLARLRRRTR